MGSFSAAHYRFSEVVSRNTDLSNGFFNLSEKAATKAATEKARLERELNELNDSLHSLESRKKTLSTWGRCFSSLTTFINLSSAVSLIGTTAGVVPNAVAVAVVVHEAIKHFQGWETFYTYFASEPLAKKFAFSTEMLLSIPSGIYLGSSLLSSFKTGSLFGSFVGTLQKALVVADGCLSVLRGENRYKTKKKEAHSTLYEDQLRRVYSKERGAYSDITKTNQVEHSLLRILAEINARCAELQLPFYAATPI